MRILDRIVLAASELPDPGQPSIIMLCGTLGALIGAAAGRLNGASRDRLTHLTADGVFVGGACGVICWLVAFAIDRL
jgi:hypothetical protein